MNSPLSYVGGKSKLSKTIIDLIPDHKTYCEVFAGAGWVFFRKEPSKYEVLNDLDGDLVSFYRVLQNHLEEFLRQFKWLLSSREWFEDWKDQLNGRGLTDIQRAARYYYVQRLCFGGKVKGRTYGTTVEHAPRINLVRLEEELSAVHLRLANVIVENLDWKDVIEKYDREGTFFYIDPPYYKTACYKYNFHKLDNFIELCERLRQIKGDFILSINDHPDMREVFKSFNLRPISVGYSVQRGEGIEGRELLISNTV
jgi:DNA adenine methylase